MLFRSIMARLEVKCLSVWGRRKMRSASFLRGHLPAQQSCVPQKVFVARQEGHHIIPSHPSLAFPARGDAERSEAEGFGQTTRLKDADRRSASCRSAVPKEDNLLSSFGVGGRCQTGASYEKHSPPLHPSPSGTENNPSGSPPLELTSSPYRGAKSNRGPKNLASPVRGGVAKGDSLDRKSVV